VEVSVTKEVLVEVSATKEVSVDKEVSLAPKLQPADIGAKLPKAKTTAARTTTRFP